MLNFATVIGLCLIISSIPLSALFCGIGIIKAPSKFKYILPIYIMVFALLAYCYEPTYENDLARYFMMMEECERLPFSQAFIWRNDGLVIKNFLFWVISKTGDFHILPALSIGILYGVTAHITADSYRNNYKNLWAVIALQILLLPFYQATSNVRNMMAFGLIVFAAYRDTVQHKKNIFTWALYILPCFIHMTGIVMVLARLAINFIKKHYKLGLVSIFFFPAAVLEIYPATRNIVFRGNIGLIVDRAIRKAYTSVLSESEYAISTQQSGYVLSCEAVMFIACAALILLILRYLSDTREGKNDGKYHDFAIFNMIVCSISVTFVLLGAIKYWVFAVGAIAASGPILSYYISDFKRIMKRDKLLLIIIAVMGFFRFSLELYYLSSRIDYAGYFKNMMTSNIFTVLGKLAVRFLLSV